jgi:transcriptional regulator with XRE-family HTH domain
MHVPEFPSTGKLPRYLRREGTPVYRLNVARLREIAAEHGDHTKYAIARRTGVNVSSAYRILDGQTQPDLISALRLAEAYDFDIRTVMDRVEKQTAVSTPAAVA